MSINFKFTRENLNTCLKELAKEFRKLNGTTMPAEIILVGGAAILAEYGFREMTYDIDAVILASSVMKDAISRVGDKFDLQNGWLNTDFKYTKSYSDKLREVSIYYKTFSNILTVRIVSAEYLIAMKLMSGRQYKNDLSDIVGILWEQERIGKPILKVDIEKAIEVLYNSADIPKTSREIIDAIYIDEDYKTLYKKFRDEEKESREVLLDFEETYPKVLNDSNIDDVLEEAKIKMKYDREK